MTKETHRVRVWASRDGGRHLEFSRDEQRSREAGLAVVERLQHDAGVEAIDMEEYVVVREEPYRKEAEEPEETVAHRGTLRWVRSGDHWREVPA